MRADETEDNTSKDRGGEDRPVFRFCGFTETRSKPAQVDANALRGEEQTFCLEGHAGREAKAFGENPGGLCENKQTDASEQEGSVCLWRKPGQRLGQGHGQLEKRVGLQREGGKKKLAGRLD